MSDAFLLLLMILGTFRLTWLITKDTFPPIRWVRERFVALGRESGTSVHVDEDGHADPHGRYVELRGGWMWISELITCYWCVSIYVAAGVTLLVDLAYGLGAPLLWFGGVAAGGALLSMLASLALDATQRLNQE